MRVAPCVALMAGCLALAGCSAFGKKSPTAAAPPARPSADAAAATDPPRVPFPTADAKTAVPVAANTGILAGQVVDSYNRRPPTQTYIQVAASNEPSAAPLDVATDANGYFTIQGLQPGRAYQLLARSQDSDGHRLAGTTWTTPPNPRVVIKISEDFASSTTPPLPPPPRVPGPAGAAPPPVWPVDTGAGPSQSWTPVPRPSAPSPTPPVNGAGLGAPVGTDGAAPKPPLRPDSITQPAGLVENRPGVPLNMNNTAVPSVPTRVPSCILTGQYLVNFALNDLTGNPWEFRKQRGRLTLIDFWETHCIPCQHAIPHLNVLQQRYGTNGLQVVGIAYEKGTPAEQAQEVNRVKQRLRINYTLLLGGGDGTPCPVREQFGVRAYPTLVLVDDTGRILWRAEGFERQQIADLDTLLRQRLRAQ